jgi:hypothetical protein
MCRTTITSSRSMAAPPTTNPSNWRVLRCAACWAAIRATRPKATRAVLLIDPFAGKTTLGPDGPTSFLRILGGVGSAFIQQTRYDSRDLMLAADDQVFSRFMLTPQLGATLGEKALASAGVGAFIGFACADFMRYDYLLGRKNCQDFLRTTFVLAENNPVFDGCWTADQKAALAKQTPGFLPIIPLMGSAAIDETLDPWPKGKLDPERYRDAIDRRFRAIFETELSGGPIRSVLGWLAAHATQRSVADYILGLMKNYLAEARLA